VANEKYDNLTTLMVTGQLNWPVDPISALLVTGAAFDKSDTTLSDSGGTWVAVVPVPGRAVDAAGNLLGLAVSFNYIGKGATYQMLIVKEVGPGLPASLLAFYDTDDQDNPLTLKDNGTLIVRPQAPQESVPDSTQGIWIQAPI
jgi:hypothetical protein